MSKPSDNPRRALGKGLSALLPARTAPAAESEPVVQPRSERLIEVPIDQIDPNPVQPREVFHADRLQELAQSIRANGILQPLLLRPAGDRFQLVAGERRWRAARLAGMERVPAIVQELEDDRLLEVSLIENLQREDLNPVEAARGFDHLQRDFKLSHEEIGKRTGKDRATITNFLRILRLPEDVQQLLSERRLSMGHAKAILGLPSDHLQSEVAAKASSQGMSVRQVERLVQRMTEPREVEPPEQVSEDPNVKAALQELERVLGTRVRIVQKSEHRGHIEIEYYSIEDLHRIYSLIVSEAELR
jgi:ParB family transcriptional regulator, chromosome partitioning protein